VENPSSPVESGSCRRYGYQHRFALAVQENFESLFRNFFKDGTQLTCIRHDSHAQECAAILAMILHSRKIDFLFIDGDHSYGGVKKDFSMYSKYMRNGGLIAFHDVAVVDKPEDVCGVHRFWRERKNDHKHIVIISCPEQAGMEIGLMIYPAEDNGVTP